MPKTHVYFVFKKAFYVEIAGKMSKKLQGSYKKVRCGALLFMVIHVIYKYKNK